MDKLHDTLIELHRGTPSWFTLSARTLPVGLLGQFLSAGLALFKDSSLLGLHGMLGGTLALPILALLTGSLLIRHLRGFGWWAGLITLLYLTQVALAAGSNPLPLAFHPVNGALLLSASLILLAKIERRRGRSLHEETRGFVPHPTRDAVP